MARRITLDFLKTESAAGLLLALAALAALAAANSPWADAYFALIERPIPVQLAAFHETRSLARWVTDGLMAIFFLVVGLEIKHEVLRGELSNPRRLALPLLAALGGVLAPAAVYLALNAGGAPHGWPTPAGMDIAAALAALALAGPRLPPTLRVFLLTVAIAQDIAATALIGLLFTAELNLAAAGGALAGLCLMALLGRWRNAPNLFYAAAFALVWAFTLKSGISTALAGVAAAMTFPIGGRRPGQPGVLQHAIDSLHPYVAYFVLPLFAFTAAGVSFQGLSVTALASPVALGVALALFLGKQAGLFGATALAIGLKLARRPTGARWLELYGVCLLCGVGFTLSLFIGDLAFQGPGRDQVRLGVLAGSLASAVCGMAVLAWAQARRGERTFD
jgi:Na+:H+ antiporter, NhaA family